MTGSARPRRAFISYVHEDAKAVDRIVAALTDAGIAVWRDVEALQPGEDWTARVREVIAEESFAFIACFSERSRRKAVSYQREELSLAAEHLRRLSPGQRWFIPVRLSDCEIPTYYVQPERFLGSYHRIDVFGAATQEGLRQLVDETRRLMGAAEAAPVGPVPAAGPATVPPGDEAWDDRAWDRLVEQLRQGDCTPVLGTRWTPTATPSAPSPSPAETVARTWAERHDHPDGPSATLGDVVEHVGAQERDAIAVKHRLARDLATFRDPDFSDPTEPHALVASLPVGVHLTTNPDDWLTRALVLASKRPVTTVCPWYAGSEDDDETSTPPGHVPSAGEPLVLHLLGSLRQPMSLAVTGPDRREVLLRLQEGTAYGGRRPLLPAPVVHAVARRPLLLLGHDLDDEAFRALILALTSSAPGGPRRRSVAVVDEDVARTPTLAGFAEAINLSIYRGTTQAFCTELAARLGH